MKIKVSLLLLLLILGLRNTSHSTDYVANNTGNWNNPNCWTPVGVPGAGDNVTIASNSLITLSSNASCNNLTLNFVNGTLVTIGNYTLEVYGTINGPSTTFSNDIITTASGKIKFSGNSRALFGSNWNATPKPGCEIALNNNQTGTTSTSVKFASLIITSGIFQVGSTGSTLDLRIDGGSNGLGDLTISSGASLVVSARCGTRSTTISTYCGNVNIFGTLTIQGAMLSGNSINIKNGGKLIINKSTAAGLASNPTNNFTYEDGSTLQYDNLISTQQVTGAEIANATNTRSVYNLIVNHVTGIDIASSPAIRNALTMTKGNIITSNASLITYSSNATLIYNSTTLQTISSTNLEYPSSNGPTNLTIDNIAGVNLNNSKTVSGALSLTNGAFSIGSNTLSLNGSIIKSNGSLTGGANSNIIFGGSGINTDLPSVTLSGLTINRANGISLSGEVNINSSITFTNGKLFLGNNNINLGSLAILTGYSTSRYIVTNGTGVLKRSGVGSTETIFPVGTDSYYAPVWITNSAVNPNNFLVTVNPDTNGSNNGMDRIQLKWEIAKENADAIDLILKMGWMNQVEGSNFASNRNTYGKLHHLIGSNWVEAGSGVYTLSGAFSDPNPEYTLSGTGITSLSPFAVGKDQGAMPVELVSFTSNVISRDLKLSWTTASELNNSGFEILRSAQNDNWVKVGYVTGIGTKTTQTNYSFEDRKLNSGKYNYRLKQIDYNGNYQYFNLTGEVEIGVPKKYDLSQNYPNPFNPVTKIDFDLPYYSIVSIKLYDISGREVMTLVNETKPAGYYTIIVEANNLSSGMYFYRIIAESSGQNYMMTKKMLMIK